VTSEISSLDSIGCCFDSSDFDLDVLGDIEFVGDILGEKRRRIHITSHNPPTDK